MARAERPERYVDPQELPEVRGAREEFFPADVVDAAYETYLSYLEGSQFMDISTQRQLLEQLGIIVHALDTLIQYYGQPGYEIGGSYEGPVHELSFESEAESSLTLARSSSRIILPEHLDVAGRHSVSLPLGNTNSYFALVKVPNNNVRTNPEMPISRGTSLHFRDERNKFGPHRIIGGQIGDASMIHGVGLEQSDFCVSSAGLIFDASLKEDFPRVMPK